jgi:N-formylglutamate deformylase
MSAAPYGLRPPAAAAVPLLVSIPHTGTWLPDEIAARLASEDMGRLPMTDWHLHELYDFLPALGATTLYATVSRFAVDLNRPPVARPLYPGRFETGLVPLETFQGAPVYRQPPDAAEVEEWRQQWHAPYHVRLKTLVEDARERFGRVVLVDAHSVASAASRLHGELADEIYLGDRDGASCGAWLRELAAGAFRGEGLRVAVNDPYKGGYITDHYGGLAGVDAIQVEMVQRVYMDERDPAGGLAHPRFGEAKARLRRAFTRLTRGLTPTSP